MPSRMRITDEEITFFNMDSSSEDDMIMLLGYNIIRKRRQRRYLEHDIVKRRREQNAFYNLVMNDLYDDDETFVKGGRRY